MTSYQSPLLTARVPYDWQELKRAAQEAKLSGTVAPAEDGVATRPAVPQEHAAHTAPVLETIKASVAAAAPVADSNEFSEEELVRRIVPKVVERLNSQIEIIVDVTLKTAATRIRADLQKAVENTVRISVREELKKLHK